MCFTMKPLNVHLVRDNDFDPTMTSDTVNPPIALATVSWSEVVSSTVIETFICIECGLLTP